MEKNICNQDDVVVEETEFDFADIFGSECVVDRT